MKWPATRDELRNGGYGFVSSTLCRSMACRKAVEMWRTPSGKTMPLSRIEKAANFGDDKLQPHFADCVDAAKFRKVQR